MNKPTAEDVKAYRAEHGVGLKDAAYILNNRYYYHKLETASTLEEEMKALKQLVLTNIPKK